MSVNINIKSDEEKVETPPEPQGVKIQIVQKDWQVELGNFTEKTE